MTWEELYKSVAEIKQQKRDGKITQKECDEKCRALMLQWAGGKVKA